MPVIRHFLMLVLLLLGASAAQAHPRERVVDLGPGYSGNTEEVLGLVVLPNGNTVVCDPYYSTATARDLGAVWLIRPDGSVVSKITGRESGDRICGYEMALYYGEYFSLSNEGIIPLADGNFLVTSPKWSCEGGAKSCGAVTWVDGERGLGSTATVGAHNSFVGSMTDDRVGQYVLALRNGEYLVESDGESIPGDGGSAITLLRGAQLGTPRADNSWQAGADQSFLSPIELPSGDLIVQNTAGLITQIKRTAAFQGTVSAANAFDSGGEGGYYGACQWQLRGLQPRLGWRSWRRYLGRRQSTACRGAHGDRQCIGGPQRR